MNYKNTLSTLLFFIVLINSESTSPIAKVTLRVFSSQSDPSFELDKSQLNKLIKMTKNFNFPVSTYRVVGYHGFVIDILNKDPIEIYGFKL